MGNKSSGERDEDPATQVTTEVVRVDSNRAITQRLVDAFPHLASWRQLYVVATDVPLEQTQFAVAAQRIVDLVQATDPERLIANLAPEIGVPPPAVLEQARRNVLLREQLLNEFGALTAREVADMAGSEALNRGQFAHSLSRAGRIFGVTHRRQMYFPGFQFASDGKPLPVFADLLPTLRTRFESDWEIALWFTTTNSWLNGQRPVDLLDNPEVVVGAARAGADRTGF